ncbi:hypothetical protein CC1G_02696 [Coprinopsis cinerea okayama7|uniref:DUF6533 domain-containing protein n=1 Tax=Coprinopsis cinerea (strain Okayama-7 / 130 / ATCC MYA-4618 / FGSC 9003) TaxID=240176 RepID=A8PBP2_COPC7|nr:hypothetical protein CC1G_02696 [Coprinopsis cinerea okayama7\|eukprot:XP_001840233.1 hypothetical protein CC1G_02696 [Coprinopsis cinerea okayama7\
MEFNFENDAEFYEWFIGSLTRVLQLKYVAVGVLTYIVSEYFATLEAEVKYIWGSKWTPVKVLFFVIRYIGFVDLPLTIIWNEATGLPPVACHGIFGTTSLICNLVTVLAEAILFLRVHALSKRSRKVGIYLATHFIISHIFTFSLFFVFVDSLKFGPATPGMPCFPLESKMDQLIGTFGVILLNQVVLTALSFYFAIKHFKDTQSPLTTTLYHDGIFYFILMAGVTISNFILSFTMPPEHKFLLAPIQRALHATLSVRIILRMRASAQTDFDFTSLVLSEVRFNRSINGELSTTVNESGQSSLTAHGSELSESKPKFLKY